MKFTSAVKNKTYLAHNVLYFSFDAPEDLQFKAGQFATITITKDGVTKYRPYSILSSPSQKGRLDFCVKIVPNGLASGVFSAMADGDEFEIKAPFGMFVLDEKDDRDVWFIATGTGITPFYSMIKEYVRKMPNRHFTLLFGVRYKKDLLFYDELTHLADEVDNFTFIPTLSRDKWEGKQGRVQKHLPEDLSGKTFYICGVKDVVVETRDLLLSKGVERKNIKYERYN